MNDEPSAFVKASIYVSKISGRPVSQLVFVVFCVGWFVLGLPTDILTAGLSIVAITLTQMVLASQEVREKADAVRDKAIHVKLDEMVHATDGARNEVERIEELSEDEIEERRNDRG